MKLKVFEVVELLDGKSQGTKYITETDIKKFLISK